MQKTKNVTHCSFLILGKNLIKSSSMRLTKDSSFALVQKSPNNSSLIHGRVLSLRDHSARIDTNSLRDRLTSNQKAFRDKFVVNSRDVREVFVMDSWWIREVPETCSQWIHVMIARCSNYVCDRLKTSVWGARVLAIESCQVYVIASWRDCKLLNKDSHGYFLRRADIAAENFGTLAISGELGTRMYGTDTFVVVFRRCLE